MENVVFFGMQLGKVGSIIFMIVFVILFAMLVTYLQNVKEIHRDDGTVYDTKWESDFWW